MREARRLEAMYRDRRIDPNFSFGIPDVVFGETSAWVPPSPGSIGEAAARVRTEALELVTPITVSRNGGEWPPIQSPAVNLDSMTVAQLRAYAMEKGIVLGMSRRTRAAILEALR